MTVLVVTAVPAEAAAISKGLTRPDDVVVVPLGAGPAAAAAGAARIIALSEAAGRPFAAVISAGVAGGFPGRTEVGATVLGLRSVAADLGAESPDGFLPIDDLGFGTGVETPDPELRWRLADALPDARTGDILTVSTVTGTAATAARLAEAHPFAVAEAMEGHGVAVAAAAAGLPFAELRTISNLIGPRDRDAWRMTDALTALTRSAAAIHTV
jgi:futalosine hydrolase